MYIMPAKEQVLDLDIGNYSIDDIARFFSCARPKYGSSCCKAAT
jgi:hypothetical protein